MKGRPTVPRGTLEELIARLREEMGLDTDTPADQVLEEALDRVVSLKDRTDRLELLSFTLRRAVLLAETGVVSCKKDSPSTSPTTTAPASGDSSSPP